MKFQSFDKLIPSATIVGTLVLCAGFVSNAADTKAATTRTFDATSVLHMQQEEQTAPPPLRIISNAEQAQLDSTTERKDRTRLSLQLADARLQRAEEFTKQNTYAAASTELGGYQALVEDALRYLQASEGGGSNQQITNKLRDLYRRFEQTLRAHTMRLRVIRRTTPNAFAVHVTAAINFVEEERTRALDAFFGEGTLQEKAAQPARPSRPDADNDTTENSSGRITPPLLL